MVSTLDERKNNLFFLLNNVLNVKVESVKSIDDNFNITDERIWGMLRTTRLNFYDVIRDLSLKLPGGESNNAFKKYFRENVFDISKEDIISILYCQYTLSNLPSGIPPIQTAQKQGNQNNQKDGNQNNQKDGNQNGGGNNNKNQGGNQNNGSQGKGQQQIDLIGDPKQIAACIGVLVGARDSETKSNK